MQDSENPDFEAQVKARFDLKNNGEHDYCGAKMSDDSGDLFGGSFTSHNPNPVWGLNPETSGKVSATLWGEGHLKLSPFINPLRKYIENGFDYRSVW